MNTYEEKFMEETLKQNYVLQYFVTLNWARTFRFSLLFTFSNFT
jgi:hypothetical protein